jgi:hypothetical protein
MRRRKDNSKSAKMMRSYTAYMRLSAKAHKAGNMRESGRYQDKALAAFAKAQRSKASGTASSDTRMRANSDGNSPVCGAR